jgi:DNA-binding transcriptional ArsR family regulator
MGLLNIIRRMHLRQKLSIREISRRTGLSRNTVTKHLAANTIEPMYCQFTHPMGFAVGAFVHMYSPRKPPNPTPRHQRTSSTHVEAVEGALGSGAVE